MTGTPLGECLLEFAGESWILVVSHAGFSLWVARQGGYALTVTTARSFSPSLLRGFTLWTFVDAALAESIRRIF
jgi:hypothetical protein